MISLSFIFLFEFYWWKWVFLLLMEMGVSFCWNLNLEYNFKLWKLLLADHLAGIYGTWFSFLFSLFIPFLKLIVTQLCCKWWLSQWDLIGVVLLFEIFLIYWVKKRYPLFHKILNGIFFLFVLNFWLVKFPGHYSLRKLVGYFSCNCSFPCQWFRVRLVRDF